MLMVAVVLEFCCTLLGLSGHATLPQVITVLVATAAEALVFGRALNTELVYQALKLVPPDAKFANSAALNGSGAPLAEAAVVAEAISAHIAATY